MIIHSASLVHFLYPYELLKDANVRGTVELLRLAVTHRLKVRSCSDRFTIMDAKARPLHVLVGFVVSIVEIQV
jgi:L-aminoadipate-semialdehyde dehydrogenase